MLKFLMNYNWIDLFSCRFCWGSLVIFFLVCYYFLFKCLDEYYCYRICTKTNALSGHIFVCKRCRKALSHFAGTYFERRKTSLVKLFQLTSMFLFYIEQKSVAQFSKLDVHTVGLIPLFLCFVLLCFVLFRMMFVGQYYHEFLEAIVKFYVML